MLVLLLWVSWFVAISGAAANEPARLQVVSSSNTALVDIPLQPGERWCLVWNHSVTGIQVEDCYRYRQGKMVLERSHQPDFAAGLGHIPGRGVQTSDGEGGYWIEHIDEPVPGNGYLLRVGSRAVNHRLSHAGNITSLSALAAGERVLIHLQTSNPTP
ncbi:DUF1850 domain-containing protein [Halomonas sp. M20]|uniref:DUF1850 domain-containing protein n=1 Tax=Halomonas sp. M20 TaxID=2763264 RepID=UPI001D0A9534|nr:DUF1850 domain-containing protein [Halomonas sp. M20]